MQRLMDRLRMGDAIGHRKSYLPNLAHIGQRLADVVAILHQLRRIGDTLRTIDEVIDPVGSVGEIRFGLYFVPSILGHDPEDERVALDIAVVMDCAGNLSVLVQKPGGVERVDEFRFTGAHGSEQLLPSRNGSIQRLAARADVEIGGAFEMSFVSNNVHCPILPPHCAWGFAEEPNLGSIHWCSSSVLTDGHQYQWTPAPLCSSGAILVVLSTFSSTVGVDAVCSRRGPCVAMALSKVSIGRSPACAWNRKSNPAPM